MLEVGALSLAAQSAIRTEWRPIGGSAALPAPPRQMPTIRASDRTDDGVVPAAADAPRTGLRRSCHPCAVDAADQLPDSGHTAKRRPHRTLGAEFGARAPKYVRDGSSDTRQLNALRHREILTMTESSAVPMVVGCIGCAILMRNAL